MNRAGRSRPESLRSCWPLRTCLAVLLALVLVACVEERGGDGATAFSRDEFIFARVTRVYDGDTFAATTAANQRIRVRLAEIDAPEKGQPWSNRARRRLTELVDGRDVSIRLFDVDTYGRIVGRIFVDDIDVNALLVAEGLAAVYRRYAEDQHLYELEARARRQQLGFWSSDYRPRGAGGS
ncbi:MAG: thermonuclease family protein [Gammaproteobacteria bacterium]|nr:thermonuclease family protein [Gammaproteobacteria bacterium]